MLTQVRHPQMYGRTSLKWGCLFLVGLLILVFERLAMAREINVIQAMKASKARWNPVDKSLNPGARILSDGVRQHANENIDPNTQSIVVLKGHALRHAEIEIALTESPEAKRLQALESKRSIGLNYGRLLAQFNLTPSDRLALVNLLADRDAIPRDVGAAISTPSTRSSDPTGQIDQITLAKEATLAADEDVNAKIAALIGADKLEELQRFSETLPQQMAVNQLQTMLAGSDAQLDAPTAQKIVDTLVRYKNTAKAGMFFTIPLQYGNQGQDEYGYKTTQMPSNSYYTSKDGNIFSTAPIPSAAVDDLTPLLSNVQMEALLEMVAQQNAETDLYSRRGP